MGSPLLSALIKLGIIIFIVGAALGFGLGACSMWVLT
jgi:hypothetical protein